MDSIGKTLIFIGFFIILIGILLLFIEKPPLGLGRLPGDILIKRDNFTFYFPLTTSIILSILLTLILTLISKLSK
jgi:Protein of unknown function (DUF2905).